MSGKKECTFPAAFVRGGRSSGWHKTTPFLLASKQVSARLRKRLFSCFFFAFFLQSVCTITDCSSPPPTHRRRWGLPPLRPPRFLPPPPVEPAPQQTLSEFSVHENLPNGGHICFLSTVGKLVEIADFFTENVLRGEGLLLIMILEGYEIPLS